MRSWLTAIRIARRETLRAKGRSVLVLAMITLPVMLLSFAAVMSSTMKLTPEERLDRQLGRGDAMVSWVAGGKIEQSPDGESIMFNGQAEPAPQVTEAKLLEVLPPGSKVNRAVADFQQKMITPNGIGDTLARAMDMTDPIITGIAKVLEGKNPVAEDEVGLTEDAAEWLNAGVGDKVRTANPERTFTVTAIVELPNDLGKVVVFRPGAVPGANADGDWLVDTPSPVTWEQVQHLNTLGIKVVSREVVLHPPAVPPIFGQQQQPEIDPQELLIAGTVTVLAVLEIILLAGPAFAVGARRRARDLAMLAAAGASPKHLRRIVLADGVVLGLAGSAGGIGGGVLLAFLARPQLEELVWHHRGGSWRFFPLALLAIAAFAVITGLLAATVPAFTAARQDVVTVLAGRRGIVRSRKRWIIVGAIMLVGGITLAILGGSTTDTPLIMAGIIIGELGLVIMTPALIGLISRLGRFMPLAPRIALRDTARNRSAAAPAISAIMAAVVGAIVGGVFYISSNQRQVDNYRPSTQMGYLGLQYHSNDREAPKPVDWAAAKRAITSVLPTAIPHELGDSGCTGKEDPTVVCYLFPRVPKERLCPYAWELTNREPTKAERLQWRDDPRCEEKRGHSYGNVGMFFVIDDGDALWALTQADPAEVAAARAALAAGAVLVHDPKYVVNGKVTVEIGTMGEQNESNRRTTELPAHVLTSKFGERSVVSFATAAKLGMKVRSASMLVETKQPPTQAEQEQLEAKLNAIANGNGLSFSVERGPHVETDAMALILALIGALIALGAAGIATGLAAADGRADLTTLGAIGAAPGVRRRLAFSQAGVISGLGAILGTSIGLGTAAILLFALNRAEAEKYPNDGPLPFLVDWKSVVAVLAMPLIAMLFAGLLTRSRIPIERPRLW